MALRFLKIAEDAPTPDAADVSDPGPLPKLAWIDKNCFAVDETYQRDPSREAGRRVIRRITENFSWRKFQPPTVVQIEDGRFVAIDGQHRILAAQMHPKVRDIPCYLIEAPEIRTQADAFVSINRDRVGLNTFQLYHAALAAGDPDSLHLQSICDQIGIRIPRNGLSAGDRKPHHLLGIRAVSKLLREFGDAPVLAALRAIFTAKAELRQSLIAALTHFFICYRKNNIDVDRLVRVLTERSARDLEEAGRAYKGVFRKATTDVAIRMSIVAEYNKGLHGSNRLPEEP